MSSKKERKYNNSCKKKVAELPLTHTSNDSSHQRIQVSSVSFIGLVLGVSSSSLTSPDTNGSRPALTSKVGVESKKGEGVVSSSTGKGTGLGGMVPFKIECSRSRACCEE